VNYDDYSTTYQAAMQPRPSRLPLILGLAGAAIGALSFGFVIARVMHGGSSAPAAKDSPPASPESTVPAQTEGTATPPAESTPEPSPTPAPPTPTPVPPTPTPTVPAITTPKFHDIYRAEGGATTMNKTTALPFRQLDASWDNSYRNCPSAGCIRGKASVSTGIGPLGTGESLVASASVYNTFSAQRADANLLMDLRWKGNLAAVVGANVNSAVDIEIIVSEIDPQTMKVVKGVPNMPYSVVSTGLGLEAIQGVDVLAVEGSRSVNIPLTLDPGRLYKIDLKITCSTRAAVSASGTTCSFQGDGYGVEWTRQVIEYDTGICTPAQKGNGCIYPQN
jgi:hypothetical protein